MHLSKSDIIAGLPAAVARQGLREMRNYGSGVATWKLPQVFGQPDDVDPDDLAERLAAAGLIQQDAHNLRVSQRTNWVRTKHGGQVAAATFAQPITRKTADAVIAAAVANARAFNDDDTKKAAVTELVVFGSYVDNSKELLGDVDMAIKVGDRFPHIDPSAYAAASERTFRSFIEEVGWWQTEAYKAVRGRRRSLSLFTEDISLALKIPASEQLVVFRDDRWPSWRPAINLY